MCSFFPEMHREEGAQRVKLMIIQRERLLTPLIAYGAYARITSGR